ncbi:MAG TPA: hypothetical protein VHS54_06105, partial [Jatrophihabitans sp.]|nr:hypothetical protein [Jatrophihabitans sp.]
MRVLTALLGAALAGWLSSPARALADPVDRAVETLHHASVYVGASTPRIDRSQLGGDALSGIKVAIVPPGGPDPVSVAKSIGSRLDPDSSGLTVLVFEGRSYGAASSARCGVGSAIQGAVDRNRSELQSTNDVTTTVLDFAAAVREAPSSANGCAGSATEDTGFGAQPQKSDHTGLIVFLVIVVLILAGIGYWLHARRRRARRELSDARAQVVPYYDRLASEVNGLEPGQNPSARQAIADAAERFMSAGSQLASADSVEKYAQARRTTLEGLNAARTARLALGVDPGPALPSIGEPGRDQLDAPRQVTVRGQTYQGYPEYTPGAPYYFGGGYGVPGGWYGVPFWETLLLGSVLTGGWGGYGSGYDTGYLSGYNAGENADADAETGNGGWGDSGGGGSWGDGGGW